MRSPKFTGSTLLIATLAVCLPVRSEACDLWDLSGLSQFKQSDGVLITISDVRQRGQQLTGRTG